MPPIERGQEGKFPQRELAGKRGAGYWRRLVELAERAGAPIESDGAAHSPERRRLLKLLGASMALAGLPACTREPQETLVPYVQRPEMLVPGRPRYYASAAIVAGYAQGVLAESCEGRPIKLEGNPDHPASLGACDAVAQASVLSLYDPDRSAAVRHRGAIASSGELLRELDDRRRQWNATRGRGLAFVTGTITSPSQRAHIDALRQRWPRARWYLHEPVDRSGVFAGSRILFGQPLEPRYHFEQVQVAATLDADFMQAQPGFLRHARDFTARRRPRDNSDDLARLYAIESTPGVTGANADHRRGLPYAQIEDAARQLAIALDIAVAAPIEKPLPEHWVKALATDLQRHPGAALVIPGDQQPAAVHALAHAINRKLDAFGSTVEWMQPVAYDAAAQSPAELVAAVNAGEIDSLVIIDSNPVYSVPADLNFSKTFRKIPWRLHWGEYLDETAKLCHWHIPAAHALETWGDARAYDGSAALLQPLIQPLHGGLSALQFLQMLESGKKGESLALLQDFWKTQYSGDDFEHFWRRSLRDGLVPESAATTVNTEISPGWLQKLPAPEPAPQGLTLQFRPDPALWDGRHANNGWLQEMPRPLTTLTWDNALLISPQLAAAEKLRDGSLVKLNSGGHTLAVPVLIMPGQPERAVTLHLGYGRTAAGRVGDGVGVSAYQLRSSQNPWAAPATIKATGAQQTLALTQVHHSIEGRDLIRTADLDRYRQNPAFAQHPAPELSLYPEPEPLPQSQDRHAWGMVIDLSACIGCNGCVTACQAENNIPVVGADEVARGHDMHWLRVDRYFPDPPTEPQPRTTFQPVPCMHCENAPCEYVCPVGATMHSGDGLNQMIYQRCVGTRYCSQNCPYKVRRFNWFDYTGSGAAHPALPPLQNPDVTVRARGVMEKCTYCVQRIASVRRDAETEHRPIREGELQTACQQACPTQAIVFGDLARSDSSVKALRASPLNYAMLEDRNTRPRTTYLAAVHNPNPELEDD
ncbi:4Fe-4S dicluster domain-containing protein [Microbulbifer halophilus]|uniref:4Fe-4S dicluster domain-containing protein n=1 Tax=Microbulbifer halophilus TaxID=453963 RepID=A0ABW5EE68_9GAMM|nr:4Fe-4S dicluster domain-containing protein [Microbulbifer halophilus]MCW8127709.1 4Fe-4S dicluster domain-containing protein [Microbulbifer halophilus]